MVGNFPVLGPLFQKMEGNIGMKWIRMGAIYLEVSAKDWS